MEFRLRLTQEQRNEVKEQFGEFLTDLLQSFTKEGVRESFNEIVIREIEKSLPNKTQEIQDTINKKVSYTVNEYIKNMQRGYSGFPHYEETNRLMNELVSSIILNSSVFQNTVQKKMEKALEEHFDEFLENIITKKLAGKKIKVNTD